MCEAIGPASQSVTSILTIQIWQRLGIYKTLDVCSSSWSIHEKCYVSEAVKAVCVADPTEKVGKEMKKYVCEHPT